MSKFPKNTPLCVVLFENVVKLVFDVYYFRSYQREYVRQLSRADLYDETFVKCFRPFHKKSGNKEDLGCFSLNEKF